MRPSVGILTELVLLALVLLASALFPAGLSFGLYIVVAELLATYLIHCPAHYLVGSLVGIRFRRIRLGRTTLARALPPGLSSVARLFPVLTLSIAKESLQGVPRMRIALMYEAGTVASVSAALVIAVAALQIEPPAYAALAWLAALAYLAFDLVFSPKSGDLARARAEGARPDRPAPQAKPEESLSSRRA